MDDNNNDIKDEIVESLLRKYDASEETIRSSVVKVTEHLRSEGLLIK